METHNINIYPSYSTKKCAVIERFNRKIKNMLYKQFSLNRSYIWIHIPQDMVKIYNERRHRTIGMKPSEVTLDHEEKLLKTLYNNQLSKPKVKKNFLLMIMYEFQI